MSLGEGPTAAAFLAGDPEVTTTVAGWIRMALAPFRFRLAEEIEDLAQEAQVELVAALTRARDAPRELRAYVWKLTVRSAIDRLRARRRWRFEELAETAQLAERSERAPSALDELLRAESRALLIRQFSALPALCRELFRQLFEGLSYREMAAVHGVREGTLRVRVLRCRQRALRLAAAGSESGGRTPGQTKGPEAPEAVDEEDP